MKRRFCPLVMAVSFFVACAAQEQGADAAASVAAASPDTAALRAEVAPVVEAFRVAVLAGDAAALNALYTDSATVELTGVPTQSGRAAIMASDSANFAMGKPTEWNASVSSTVPTLGGGVAQRGSWSDATPVKGGQMMRRAGRWLAVMQKGTDGQWRISYLMAMTDSTTTGK